jgi:hypothetical protein
LSREFKRLRVAHFINQAIAQSASRPPGKHLRQPGILVCGTMQGVSVDMWNRCFRTSKKRGTDLYAARPSGATHRTGFPILVVDVIQALQQNHDSNGLS